MKTAMQYLKDDILIEKQLGFITENASKRIIDYIDNLYLEKEKEQIIDAFEVGYKSCDIDEAFEINRKLASGELHYNQTYNQNK
jgi:hypothetical protein